MDPTKVMNFEEYKKCLTEDQVKIETSRCLSCGASVVDEVKCIGCGQCTTKCEFDAIHLYRTHKHGNDMYACEQRMVQLAKYIPKRLGKIISRPVREALKSK